MNQKGFAPAVIFIIAVLLSAIGAGVYLKSYHAPQNKIVSSTPTPSPSILPTITQAYTRKTIISPTKSPTPTITITPSSSTNSSSSNQTSVNTPTPNVPTATVTPISSSPTPTPTQSVSCSTVCFDRSSSNVTVTQSSPVESGGYTSFAFNLTGHGSKGFLVNSGLPPGIALSPSSGGFTDGTTLPVKVWINNNGVPQFGTYTTTVTLKTSNSDGSYFDTGNTLNLTVTYQH